MAAFDTPRPSLRRTLRLPIASIMIGISTLGIAGPLSHAQEPVPGGPAPGAGPVTADERRDVVERIAKLLEERYVFPEVGIESGRKLKSELERGAFNTITDPREFAQAVTTTLQAVNHDKHMRVVVKQPQAVAEDRVDPIAQHLRQRQQMEAGNFGFQQVSRMEGNVGYLDLRGFAPADLARETAVAAMRILAGSDAIVIDLRKNGGGSPDMVRLLCSYFFEKPTHLNSLYWREGDRTQEFWSTDDVPGPRMTDIPLFVVTSNGTFSAAEEFSYNLQSRKRATFVGETTGGGANPGGVFPANDRFGIFVPTGRAINPVTKTNWEGTGIKPDVKVAADAALDTALQLARVAAEAHRRDVTDANRIDRETLTKELKRAEALFTENKRDEASRVVAGALETARARDVVDEGLINWLGYDYMGRKSLPMAIAIFEYNTKAFPASGNTYDSLGEALLNAGDKERGLANYRRSLELDPQNGNARAIIEKMGSEKQ
jgi:tetratricopeptide (TPR) repeat protein